MKVLQDLIFTHYKAQEIMDLGPCTCQFGCPVLSALRQDLLWCTCESSFLKSFEQKLRQGLFGPVCTESYGATHKYIRPFLLVVQQTLCEFPRAALK